MKDSLSTLGLRLVSPAFKEGDFIPDQYTCRGQNVNPPLSIMGVNENVKSLALIMHDPDAVSGDFVHWLVWDIPSATKSIAPNSVPTGAVQGANSSGQRKYMGPCPPVGTGSHRYQFELYALDSPLSLPEDTTRSRLEEAISGHRIDYYRLTGLFADGR